MRSASPPPAVSGSPPPRPPRSSCGRCTRPSPPELSCCCTERKVVIVTENDPKVVDHAEARRFEVLVDGEVAGFAEYRATTSSTAVTHTVIDPGFDGRGLGSVLARGALDA